MTAYTCKRLCCSVVTVLAAKDLTLNGERLTVRELALGLGLTIGGMRRRIKVEGCLQRARQHDKQPKQKPVAVPSESARLAALFLKLPRSAA